MQYVNSYNAYTFLSTNRNGSHMLELVNMDMYNSIMGLLFGFIFVIWFCIFRAGDGYTIYSTCLIACIKTSNNGKLLS